MSINIKNVCNKSFCWMSFWRILCLLENSRLARINSERHQFEPRNFEHYIFVVFSHFILTINRHKLITGSNKVNTEDYRIAEKGMTKDGLIRASLCTKFVGVCSVFVKGLRGITHLSQILAHACHFVKVKGWKTKKQGLQEKGRKCLYKIVQCKYYHTWVELNN